jgi:hypothetical protein
MMALATQVAPNVINQGGAMMKSAMEGGGPAPAAAPAPQQ